MEMAIAIASRNRSKTGRTDQTVARRHIATASDSEQQEPEQRSTLALAALAPVETCTYLRGGRRSYFVFFGRRLPAWTTRRQFVQAPFFNSSFEQLFFRTCALWLCKPLFLL